MRFKNIIEDVYRYENNLANSYENLILYDKNEDIILHIKKPFVSNFKLFTELNKKW